jgi:glycosyltransferase involved in cell wall biosynthesis
MRKQSEKLLIELASIWEPQVRHSLADLTARYERSLVSIIIPCYNNAAYVSEAIQSALDQSYRPCEVIVIDDYSTDDSWDVIQSFGDRILSRRRSTNSGACVARNDGLELARGEFIQFLDADDLLPPHSIQARHDLAIQHPECTIFGAWEGFLSQPGDLPSLTNPKNRDQFTWPNTNCPISFHMSTYLPLHIRSNLYRCGGFDEQIPAFQDQDLYARLSCFKSAKFLFKNTIASYTRQHDSPYRISNNFARNVLRQPETVLSRFSYYYTATVPILDDEGRRREYDALRQTILTFGRQALSRKFKNEAFRFFAVAQSLEAQHLYNRRFIRLIVLITGISKYEHVKMFMLCSFAIALRAIRRLKLFSRSRYSFDQAKK